MASPGISQPPPVDSDVILITAQPAQIGRTRIPAAIDDPINLTFDNAYDRLLILKANANMLLSVKAGPDGRLNPNTLAHFNTQRFGLHNPQGLAIDPASGDLFVLDSAVSCIMRVVRAPDGSFDETGVSRVDLQHLGSASLRGLAIDPASGHLHVLDSAHQALYEITTAGQVHAIRDLSSLNLNDPRGMVFAPSGDQTDDPSQMSLYLADSGLGAGRGSRPRGPGQIVELSLAAPAAAAASSFQSTLVRTTDTAAISPPSPDPDGLTYMPLSNTLLVSDSEVEERVSGITHFVGANLWEITLTGGVVRTANISQVAPTLVPMTNEPTGMAWNPANGHYYFSDDDDRRVYDLNPGPDGLPGTADDTWTSFSTHAAGDDDPKGITYDTLHDRIFVADGNNREVYEYTTAGVLVNQFDVQAYGVVDPESVEFSPDLGTLFVLSNVNNPIIIETTTSGALLQTIDFSAANAEAPAGLAYAPASVGSGAKRFYIVDRGIDYNVEPNIIDGKTYEMTSPSITPGNQRPTADAGIDQTVIRSQGAILQGQVSDDGIPGGTVAVAWSKASGPGAVTFSNPNVMNTSAGFSSIGNYVLRLTADDGELVSSDDVNVTVTGDNGEMLSETRVAASADDAEESSSGSMSLTSSDLELVYDGSNQTVGMRFNGISIPQGTSITNAYIQFTVDETNSESTSLTIQGENTDQAATFTTVSRNISSRARTAAAVSWSPNPWTTIGAAGADQQTPNIASVIQEIVTRPGWLSGHSLAIIITGTGHRTARAYDYSPVLAPLLHIEYRSAVANHAPVAVADAYATNEDASLVVAAKDVLTNDTDAEGDTLTALLNAGLSHGTLTLNTNGSFTYTPAANYNGSDSFTFKVNDGTVDSNIATVSITVTPLSNAPAPTISSLGPSSAIAGGAAFTLTVTGTNFVSTSVVRWNGGNRTTTFVSSTRLTAVISAADIAVGQTVPVTVFTPAPGGGTSNAITFTVNNPAPATTSLSPSSVTAGGTSFTLTVNGTGFVPSSVVRWSGSSRTTTFLSSTQLTASIPASDIATGKTVSIKVYNATPGGGTSNAQTFMVNNPVPAATSLSPTAAYARGGPAFTLAVYGTGFATNSIIRWNGTDRPTMNSSSTKVKITVSTADLAMPGPVEITVFTPAPGGGLSNALTFTINNPPVPTNSSLSPSSGTAGGADFTLTVNGGGFVTDSKVRWNGVDRTTTFVSSTRLTAAIPAADIAVAGTALVSVFTPAPGGGSSSARTFTINSPVP